MKICGIICEFNPFHNGHEYLLGQAARLSGCDGVLALMSGNFTQRGEIAALEKSVRARHAVLGGADCVTELPVSFTVAPAEIFAAGAVKLLSSVPALDCIVFGCESGDEKKFREAARVLSDESEQFKAELEKQLDAGNGYAKSYAEAFYRCGGERGLCSSPNNILGIEYAKAVAAAGRDIRLIPVQRMGSAYGDAALKENFSSAAALRANRLSPLVKSNVPAFAADDFINAKDYTREFGRAAVYKLYFTPEEKLRRVYGCAEGLEHALKSRCAEGYDGIVEGCTNRRYTAARIKRILCANLLDVYADDAEEFLNSELYHKPIAVKQSRADEILSALAGSPYPVAIRGRDRKNLSVAARRCMDVCARADEIYSLITGGQTEYYSCIKV